MFRYLIFAVFDCNKFSCNQNSYVASNNISSVTRLMLLDRSIYRAHPLRWLRETRR